MSEDRKDTKDIKDIKDAKDTQDLDSFENYFQNSVAQAANTGAFSFVISPVNELTQINNRGIETNDNLNEKREVVKELNELDNDEE